ncbi:MAG: TolC family protein, partial [Planctomycetota bacterium]
MFGAAAVTVGGCGAPYPAAPRYQPGDMDATIAAQSKDMDAQEAANGLGAGAKPPAAIDTAKPLTLDDCLRLALANDRNLRIADRRVLIAKDRVDQAVASIMPQADLSAKYETRSNDNGVKTPFGSFKSGQSDVGTATANLLVPIYDFGAASATEQALELGVDSARFDALAQRQATALDVRETFYRVLEARTMESIVTDSLKVVDRQLTIAKDFHAQGLVARNDVLAAEVQHDERTDEILQARSNVDLAVATLNRLLGLDLSHPTQLDPDLDQPAWPDSYGKTLQQAIAHRPELAGLRKQIDRARAEYLAMQRQGHNPDLYAYGSYNLSTDDTLLNQQWLVGGLGLKLPLFDGGQTWAELNRKSKEIAELIDERDDRADDVVLSVKQAWIQLHTVREQLPVDKAAIQLAQDNLSVEQDRYQQGLVTSADVLTEEDRLAHARGNYTRALYGYNESYATLLHAVGTDLPPADLAGIEGRDPTLPAEEATASAAGAAPATATTP